MFYFAAAVETVKFIVFSSPTSSSAPVTEVKRELCSGAESVEGVLIVQSKVNLDEEKLISKVNLLIKQLFLQAVSDG